MPTNLKNLILEEVSLVDEPANKQARVTIFKRNIDGDGAVEKAGNASGPTKDVGDQTMSQDLEKKVADLQSQVADLTKAKTDAEAKLAEVTKKAEVEYIEIDGEKVEKSAVPAPILKQLTAQAEAIAKMQADAEAEKLAKRAVAELPNIGGTVEMKGQIIKALDGIEGALEVIKSADKLVSLAMKEVGFSKADEDSPMAKLDTIAKAHAKEHGVTYAAAYAEVTKSGEGLALFNKRRDA